MPTPADPATPNRSAPAIGANDCFVTDNVVSSARNLIDGTPLTPMGFADLCALIEMAVLHERIIMTLPTLTDSPLSVLLDQGVITSNMFTDNTPSGDTDKLMVQTVYERCFHAITNAGVFGSGILNKPDTHEEEIERAINRLKFANLLVHVDQGKIKVEPGAEEKLNEAKSYYSAFTDYADAVFDAARHFHVHAYAGSSETPFVVQKTVRSAPRKLYDKLRELHTDRVDQILAATGYKTYDIPPLALIVLSRAKTREDIVPQILRAREEFAAFRDTCTRHAREFDAAAKDGTIEDVIALNNDLDRAIAVLTAKTKASAKDQRFTYRLWDVVKEASLTGMGKALLGKFKEYDIEREHLRTVNGLMDIWHKLGKASGYEAVLRAGPFGREFAEEDFAAFGEFMKDIRAYVTPGTTPGAH